MYISLAHIVAALIVWLSGPSTEPFPVIWDTQTQTVTLVGDDNLDRFIDEDESGWICATMGNRICG